MKLLKILAASEDIVPDIEEEEEEEEEEQEVRSSLTDLIWMKEEDQGLELIPVKVTVKPIFSTLMSTITTILTSSGNQAEEMISNTEVQRATSTTGLWMTRETTGLSPDCPRCPVFRRMVIPRGWEQLDPELPASCHSSIPEQLHSCL